MVVEIEQSHQKDYRIADTDSLLDILLYLASSSSKYRLNPSLSTLLIGKSQSTTKFIAIERTLAFWRASPELYFLRLSGNNCCPAGSRFLESSVFFTFSNFLYLHYKKLMHNNIGFATIIFCGKTMYARYLFIFSFVADMYCNV